MTRFAVWSRSAGATLLVAGASACVLFGVQAAWLTDLRTDVAAATAAAVEAPLAGAKLVHAAEANFYRARLVRLDRAASGPGSNETLADIAVLIRRDLDRAGADAARAASQEAARRAGAARAAFDKWLAPQTLPAGMAPMEAALEEVRAAAVVEELDGLMTALAAGSGAAQAAALDAAERSFWYGAASVFSALACFMALRAHADPPPAPAPAASGEAHPLESAPSPVLLIGPDGAPVYANRRMIACFPSLDALLRKGAGLGAALSCVRVTFIGAGTKGESLLAGLEDEDVIPLTDGRRMRARRRVMSDGGVLLSFSETGAAG